MLCRSRIRLGSRTAGNRRCWSVNATFCCTLSFIFFPDTGAQPLVSEDGKVILAVNGEIYNHIALRETVGPDVKFKTHSDCEVIIPLVCPLIAFLVFIY
jgi:asparagine synthetase B (glutamine-hydrolysing)